MKPPGRERIRMLRHEGAKAIEDATMIPDTLHTLLAAARAADGVTWLLMGSQAASCWMESRATVVIEVLVPTPDERALVQNRLGTMPHGHSVVVRTAEEAGVSAESLALWSKRARRDDLDGVTVLVPQPGDLFLLMLAVSNAFEAPQAMFFAATLLLLHGPFHLADAELSPYQQERMAQAAALAIHHAANEIERLTPQLGT